mmetsp:Transcript_107156/g.186133  ORF Transcript_107156/g.186133 Transcript_107156/m.186133 type:complete len:285 (-) Transcript_107156:7-861(-)
MTPTTHQQRLPHRNNSRSRISATKPAARALEVHGRSPILIRMSAYLLFRWAMKLLPRRHRSQASLLWVARARQGVLGASEAARGSGVSRATAAVLESAWSRIACKACGAPRVPRAAKVPTAQRVCTARQAGPVTEVLGASPAHTATRISRRWHLQSQISLLPHQVWSRQIRSDQISLKSDRMKEAQMIRQAQLWLIDGKLRWLRAWRRSDGSNNRNRSNRLHPPTRHLQQTSHLMRSQGVSQGMRALLLLNLKMRTHGAEHVGKFLRNCVSGVCREQRPPSIFS